LEGLETRLTPSLSTLASFGWPNGNAPHGAVIMDTSGNLYSTTTYGGAFNDGTVIEVPRGSGAIKVLASFGGINGANPQCGLLLDSSGNLYGTTSAGGASSDGTVFELAQGSGTITTVASFNGVNGSQPVAALTMDASGNLYGTAKSGGAANGGTVFEVARGSGTITVLASFNGTNGANPECGLLLDNGGNLYGTTYGGGTSGQGTVFELAQGSGTITTLASFNGTDGANPVAGLITDGSGNLYGTTENWGTSGHGTVFELAQGSGTITTLASFNDVTNGAYPAGALIMDGSGNLYGTTESGPSVTVGRYHSPGTGTLFEVARGSTTITTLAKFNNGTNPVAALIMDGAGNLYGTTRAGGPGNSGTVFEFVHGKGTITTLASCGYNNGDRPYGALARDGSGNLYGVTTNGGAFNDGTVFEVAAGTGTIRALTSIDASNADPTGLIVDGNGNLYGTSQVGGAFGYGTVFELAAGSTAITTLASFDGTQAAYPYAPPIMDSSGNLYGTTSSLSGGTGTVFELARGTGTITILASFASPSATVPGPGGLIMDSSGNLYGTTPFEGSFGDGIIFELAQGSGTITTLASFNGTNGANPAGALIMDGSGNLYGTAKSGGAANDGTVFELAHGSGTVTTLASFHGTDGAEPVAGVIMDGGGNLYGTTYAGGAFQDGTVFKLAPGSGTVTTLASFDVANGNGPGAPLVMDSSGNLYGTTEYGGATNFGTVFELPPTAGPTDSLAVSGFPNSTTAGMAGNFTVTVYRTDGTIDTGYTGTVRFTSSDPHAVLPANYSFTPADGGVHTFSATLKTAGSQSITTTDTVTGITGSESGIVVNPAAASQFILSAPSSVRHGTAFSLTLTVEDAYGNVVTGYVGTVHFSSSDSTATLPPDYTFTAADAGVHTFTSAAILRKRGTQTITVTDRQDTALTATNSISVT
jgi:uncharacterized repeat protein (TIGR03803 family)